MVASYDEALQAAASGGTDQFLLDGAFLSRVFEDGAGDAAGRIAKATTAPVDVLWPAPTPEQEAALLAVGVRLVIAKPIAPTALVQILEDAAGASNETRADVRAA